jgi:malate dehydrogenase
MVTSWLEKRSDPLPCASYLTGQYGLADVALAVPVALVPPTPRVVELALTGAEQDQMRRAAASVVKASEALETALAAALVPSAATGADGTDPRRTL